MKKLKDMGAGSQDIKTSKLLDVQMKLEDE